MIFTNARVTLREGIRDDLDVAIREGKIVEIGPQIDSTDAIDLGGRYLAPGFVDLHIHGAVGRDTMEASAEAFRAICDYHLRGGTTSLLLTTATAPLDRITAAIDSARKAKIPQVAGVHMEGPFISSEKA